MWKQAGLIVVAAVLCVACENINSENLHPTAPTPPAPPSIVKFEADATRLGPPNGSVLDTYLRWDVIGEGGVRCRIDQSPGQPIGDVPNAGSQQVRPGVTTMYTMTCTNLGGTVTRSLTIVVN
jgi:hypothetical protein